MRLWKAYHSGTPGLCPAKARGIPLLLIATAFVLAPAAGDARLGVVATNVHASQAADAPRSAALNSPAARKAGVGENQPAPVTVAKQPVIRAQVAELLRLAQQLQSDVKKTNKDMLSLSVVRRADEIEKLARAMKAERSDHSHGTH